MKNFLFLFIFISSITASFAQNTDGSQTGDNSLDNKNLQEANLANQDNLWANNGVDFNNFDGMPGGEGTALPSCDPNSPNPETCGTLDNSNSTSGFFDKITKTMNKTVENMRVKVEELVTEKHAQFANTGAFTGASQRVLYSTGGSTSTSVKTVQSKNCENVAPGISTCFGETINGVGEGNSSLFDTLEAISFFNSKEQILNMDESNCEKCFGKYEQMYKNSQRGGKRVLNKNIIEDGVKEKIKLRKLKFEALKLVNKIESLGDAGSVRSETVNRSKLSCLDNNFLETELTAVNCSKSDSDLLKTTFAKIGVRGVDKTLDLNKITKTLERKKSLFCSSGQLSRKNYVNLNTRNLYIKDTSAYHQLKDATDLFDTKFTKKEVNHLCHSKKDITPFEYLQKIIVSNNDLETFDFGFKDPLFKILLTSKKAFCSYQKNRSPSSGVLNFLRLKEGGDKNALLALQKKVMHNYDSSCKKNIKNIVKVACSDISGDLNEVVAKYGHTEMKNSLRDVLLESVDDNGDFFQKRAVGIATLTCQLSSVEKGKSLETNYDSVDLLQSGEYSDLSLQELKKELIAQKDYIVNKKEVDNLLKSSFLGSEIPKEEERVCPKFVFSNKSMREKLYGEQRTAGERKKDLVQEVRSSSGGDGKLKGEILSEAERNSLRNGLNGKNTASTTKKTLDGGAEIKEIEDSRFTSLSGSGSTYNPAGPDSMTSQYLPEVPAIGDFTESDLDKVKEFTKDPEKLEEFLDSVDNKEVNELAQRVKSLEKENEDQRKKLAEKKKKEDKTPSDIKEISSIESQLASAQKELDDTRKKLEEAKTTQRTIASKKKRNTFSTSAGISPREQNNPNNVDTPTASGFANTSTRGPASLKGASLGSGSSAIKNIGRGSSSGNITQVSMAKIKIEKQLSAAQIGQQIESTNPRDINIIKTASGLLVQLVGKTGYFPLDSLNEKDRAQLLSKMKLDDVKVVKNIKKTKLKLGKSTNRDQKQRISLSELNVEMYKAQLKEAIDKGDLKKAASIHNILKK